MNLFFTLLFLLIGSIFSVEKAKENTYSQECTLTGDSVWYHNVDQILKSAKNDHISNISVHIANDVSVSMKTPLNWDTSYVNQFSLFIDPDLEKENSINDTCSVIEAFKKQALKCNNFFSLNIYVDCQLNADFSSNIKKESLKLSLSKQPEPYFEINYLTMLSDQVLQESFLLFNVIALKTCKYNQMIELFKNKPQTSLNNKDILKKYINFCIEHYCFILNYIEVNNDALTDIDLDDFTFIKDSKFPFINFSNLFWSLKIALELKKDCVKSPQLLKDYILKKSKSYFLRDEKINPKSNNEKKPDDIVDKISEISLDLPKEKKIEAFTLDAINDFLNNSAPSLKELIFSELKFNFYKIPLLALCLKATPQITDLTFWLHTSDDYKMLPTLIQVIHQNIENFKITGVKESCLNVYCSLEDILSYNLPLKNLTLHIGRILFFENSEEKMFDFYNTKKLTLKEQKYVLNKNKINYYKNGFIALWEQNNCTIFNIQLDTNLQIVNNQATCLYEKSVKKVGLVYALKLARKTLKNHFRKEIFYEIFHQVMPK